MRKACQIHSPRLLTYIPDDGSSMMVQANPSAAMVQHLMEAEPNARAHAGALLPTPTCPQRKQMFLALSTCFYDSPADLRPAAALTAAATRRSCTLRRTA
jgi:hypothetical protein